MYSSVPKDKLALLALFSAIFIVYHYRSHQETDNLTYNIPDPDCTGVFNLCTDADKERLARQAIHTIHDQIDDDKDGSIRLSESDDFIHEELESKTDDIRHKQFQSVSLRITFDDLWNQWQNNAVYNWTTDDVIHWLINDVHLSQYVAHFRRNQIDGRLLPRLAANEKQYMNIIMHIRDIRDKQRLIVKAMDVVLFGPPEKTSHFLKDVVLLSSLFLSMIGCIYAFIRQYRTEGNLNLMLKELETLQQTEGNLLEFKEKIRVQKRIHFGKRLLCKLFTEIQRTKDEANRFSKCRGAAVDQEKQLSLAIQEIEQLQIALKQAQEQSTVPPSELLDLLKMTYHKEEKDCERKRKLAETSLITARDHMNKISKMQKGFIGALRIAHSNCMVNGSELVETAKEQMNKVHLEYEEREERWKRIASLLNDESFIGSSSSASLTRPRL